MLQEKKIETHGSSAPAGDEWGPGGEEGVLLPTSTLTPEAGLNLQTVSGLCLVGHLSSFRGEALRMASQQKPQTHTHLPL